MTFQIFPANQDRFEIPEEALNITSPEMTTGNDSRVYNVTFQDSPVFGVVVTRRSTGAVV